MKEKLSALYSKYIIDGIQQALTPAQILNDCLARQSAGKTVRGAGEFGAIVDESIDPDPAAACQGSFDIQDCLGKVRELEGCVRAVPMAYSRQFTVGRIAKALLETIWRKGRFRLSDLTLSARWRWDPRPVGNLASFFSSAEGVADYLGCLGIGLSDFAFSKSEGLSSVQFKVGASGEKAALSAEDFDADLDEESSDIIDIPGGSPFGSEHPVIRRSRALPDILAGDPESWILYVPFDSCEFRLGHSLLGEALGRNCDTFPDLGDGDYFVDCYEIIREFVEDGIVLSGITVGEGGLLAALDKMCGSCCGASIDINGIMEAYGEESSARVLFSEVPGVLVQIKDIDYDYSDAEFLLQDIAYYPIGHPVPGSRGISVRSDGQSGITSILQSLLSGQALEGED